MTTELCRHELPKDRCDICSPREPVKQRGSNQNPTAAVTVENPDTVIVAANVAYGEYLKYNAYVCQPDRAFRTDARWMGFYANEAIQKEVPEILHVWDRVRFSREKVDELRKTDDPVRNELADLIEVLAEKTTRRWDEDFKVFLLSPSADARTHKLPKKVSNSSLDRHGSGTAYTQGQRYSRIDALLRGPANTDELHRFEQGNAKPGA